MGQGIGDAVSLVAAVVQAVPMHPCRIRNQPQPAAPSPHFVRRPNQLLEQQEAGQGGAHAWTKPKVLKHRAAGADLAGGGWAGGGGQQLGGDTTGKTASRWRQGAAGRGLAGGGERGQETSAAAAAHDLKAHRGEQQQLRQGYDL